MSIKTKQVAGVTTIVGCVVVVLSVVHLAALARVNLAESESRGEMLAHAIFQRAHDVVRRQENPYAALQADAGIRSLLEASMAYSRNVTYAAIVDSAGIAVAHSFPTMEGEPVEAQENLQTLRRQSALAQLRAIYSDRMFELRQPLLFGDEEFGSIRIGLSMLLIRSDLQDALRQAIETALLALLIATVAAMLLAQWMLRPIHVIRSGLSRLGRGEFGVTLDLPESSEFRELGTSFAAVSARLAADRQREPAAAGAAGFESIVDSLEDAGAMFNPGGELLFANPAMRATLPDARPGAPIDDCCPPGHPYRKLVEATLASRRSQGPLSAPVAVAAEPAESAERAVERLIVTHALADRDARFVGVLLVARNIEYLSHVHSTINYSRKLAALGRLTAGVAHEVKNPLNAMTIHLELLKQKLTGRTAARARAAGRAAGTLMLGEAEPAAPPPEAADVLKHTEVIADEIRRLDQVMLGFLKFTKPDELRLQPIQLDALISEVVTIVEPQARAAGVDVRVDLARELPDINGDAGMLQQALLNLALNACQAMPDGGVLRFVCRPASGRRVEVLIEDGGVGIPPEHLQRIFDLYFTTRERGSGIGLSMVYRTMQLHDGEVEVQSTPGRGTTFRLLLPQT
jgi:signal transduction histidine kinase